MEIEVNGYRVADGDVVEFTYKNWKGEVGERRVAVEVFFWGSTEYHPEPQFLLAGYDIDKGARRAFAMKDITDLYVVTHD